MRQNTTAGEIRMQLGDIQLHQQDFSKDILMKCSNAVQSCKIFLMIRSGHTVLYDQKQDKIAQNIFILTVCQYETFHAIVSSIVEQIESLLIPFLLSAGELQTSRKYCTHHPDLEKQCLMFFSIHTCKSSYTRGEVLAVFHRDQRACDIQNLLRGIRESWKGESRSCLCGIFLITYLMKIMWQGHYKSG